MVDARLDLQRRRRLGMVEAIWGEHKTGDQIIAILKRFEDAGSWGWSLGWMQRKQISFRRLYPR